MNTVCCFDKFFEKLLGRKNKYREVVTKARDTAKNRNITMIVYQLDEYYTCCRESIYYNTVLPFSDEPVIKLLICLPDGTVAQ